MVSPAADRGGWMARFAAEFPGMTMERNAVMAATSVQAPPRLNTEAVLRTLEGDADWLQSFELTAATYPASLAPTPGSWPRS
jgi:hypothetical protein